jgi:hypothetical protein
MINALAFQRSNFDVPLRSLNSQEGIIFGIMSYLETNRENLISEECASRLKFCYFLSIMVLNIKEN